MKRELLALPNLLSLTRALLGIPFVIVMMWPSPSARWWACAIILFGALTDKLDGVLARRLGIETETGRILDPLADKIGVAVISLVLLWRGEIPMWFVAVLLGRDLLILAGGIYLKTTYHLVVPSNLAGKWTVGVSGLLLFLLVAGVEGITLPILMGLTLVLLSVSLSLYARRFLTIVHTSGGKTQ